MTQLLALDQSRRFAAMAQSGAVARVCHRQDGDETLRAAIVFWLG